VEDGFQHPLRHFEYLVMPFGLSNAPAVSQDLINNVLHDYLNLFIWMTFPKSPSGHRQHVRLVLQCLLENRLYIKAQKCEFHVSSISFLGYIFQDRQVKTDPDKMTPVAEWLTLSNTKQL